MTHILCQMCPMCRCAILQFCHSIACKKIISRKYFQKVSIAAWKLNSGYGYERKQISHRIYVFERVAHDSFLSHFFFLLINLLIATASTRLSFGALVVMHFSKLCRNKNNTLEQYLLCTQISMEYCVARTPDPNLDTNKSKCVYCTS